MARLPKPGGDAGQWGDILNEFLEEAHNSDGTLKNVPIAQGGTGATDANGALTNLGAASSTDLDTHAADLTLHSSGRELAYASSAAQQTGIGNSQTDLTGLTISFTVGSRPVDVEVFLPWAGATNAGAIAVAHISDLSNTSIMVCGSTVSTAGGITFLKVVERITTPGDYDRKAQMSRVSGSGTVSNNSGLATTVSYIRAIER